MSKGYKFKKFKEISSDSEENIWLHNHCKVCNKITPPKEEYCSDACRGIVENKEKRDKKKMYKTIGITVVAFIVIIIVLVVMSTMG